MLKADPEYSNRDALYFHLAESLYLQGQNTQLGQVTDETASGIPPYYGAAVQEFEKLSISRPPKSASPS